MTYDAPRNANGYAMEKGLKVRAWYHRLDEETKQLVNMAMLELETGIKKRAEKNGQRAYIGPTSTMELVYELARFVGSG
jgi:hypothetical protein